jgi:hypothetical protein
MMMNAPIFEPTARRFAGRWPLISLCLWFVLVAALFAFLWTYESTAGSAGDPKASWPQEASIKPSEGRALLMFAHPRCPCTRASLKELAEILANRPVLESATVIFFRPKHADGDWTDSRLVRQARSIKGVDVGFDEDGLLARKFGVETSGHVLLYDGEERLLFSGGITAFRSHEGPNAGRDAVLALCQGQTMAMKATPIFGCPLYKLSAPCTGDACEVGQ